MNAPAKSGKEWSKLSPYQHLKTRTEMYFGSRDPHTQIVLEYDDTGPKAVETTWTPAGFTAVREILDNAIDEVVSHGHGDRIDFNFDPNKMIFSVSDNGRGIPINWDEDEKDYAATILLSHTLTGRNFEDDRGETRGVNGIGAKGVNFCSEFFDVEIDRDKKHFKQLFREGPELVTERAIIMPGSPKKSGTRIKFKLSSQVFSNLLLPETFIAARVFEVALCYPALKIFYNGNRIVTKGVESLFSGGKPITFNITTEGFSSKFWLMPNFMKDRSEYAYGMVNAIPVFNGGTHIDAFKRNFYSGLLEALKRESKRRKLEPSRADIADGLLIYNITQMSAPAFDSQSKTRLINEPVAKIVTKEMADPEFFKKVIRSYPDWIEQIFERCAARTLKKDLSDIDKMAKKAKRTKVEDLEDACGYDRSKCILFLAEGKSAISGVVEARNPDIHGGLPLRGKPMNIRDHTIREVMANEPLTKIMNSLGLFIGQRVNRHTLRYGRVFLTTDADEDGKNIAALLVNFFYGYWPELFDPQKAPFIYILDTPLIIATKGKQRKYWYNDNYSEFDTEKMKGWEITRAKGLAALKRDDWRYVLENPKLMPVVDDGQLDDTLKLIFDKVKGAADARKEWIGR